MSYTSCISHPANNPLIKIYDWQLKAMNNDYCAANLLSFFESIINNDHGINEYHNKFSASKNYSLIKDVGIPLKLSSLREGLLHQWAEKKISASLDHLEEKGFIKINVNPDPEQILDRKKYIRFYPEVCNAWIRENYNNDGYLINQPELILDSPKRQCRFRQKGESTMPKGSVDYAKKENRECQKGESEKESYPQPDNHLQLIDILDNSKRESRFGEKGESILPKGVTYNNINQSISININQDECENINQSDFNKPHDEKLNTGDESVDAIVNALITQGLPAEKFNYPDAIPAIAQLQQAGASIALFVKAYEISARATHGKSFGVRYLVKVVEGLLAKSQKGARKISSGYQYKQKAVSHSPLQQKKYVYENDLKNAESWAADLF